MVIRAKVPSITAPKSVVPRVMEIKPKIPGIARTWTPGAIGRRFGQSSVSWGKK